MRPIYKDKSIPERMTENLALRGIKDPNEGLAEPKFRTVGDFILGGAKEQMRLLAFGDQAVVYGSGNNTANASLQRKPDIEEWAKDM